MIYLISFEANELLHDYAPVIEVIKSFGDYQHPMTTLWFVKSNLRADEIYREIKPKLRDKDHLFVIEITTEANRQGWLSRSFWAWLRNDEKISW